MQRATLRATIILALLFAAAPLISLGKSEQQQNDQEPSATESWSITVPAAALPGDLATVSFHSDEPLTDAVVTLKTATGAQLSQTTAFSADASAPAGNTLIALVALPSTLEPGVYAIEAQAMRKGKTIRSASALTVEARAFLSETVDLDTANSAIKNNLGPERLAQIKALNDILFFQDSTSPRFAGPFKPPLTSTRRTAQYGDRRTYRHPDGKNELALHYGIDFGVPTGTPVFAIGDGLVVMAERRISTGWTVVVEHLPGVYSLYYHLDALTASKGELVRTGTLIGRSGATGLATGPHLHWEVRVNGEAVSPDYFTGRTLF